MQCLRQMDINFARCINIQFKLCLLCHSVLKACTLFRPNKKASSKYSRSLPLAPFSVLGYSSNDFFAFLMHTNLFSHFSLRYTLLVHTLAHLRFTMFMLCSCTSTIPLTKMLTRLRADWFFSLKKTLISNIEIARFSM